MQHNGSNMTLQFLLNSRFLNHKQSTEIDIQTSEWFMTQLATKKKKKISSNQTTIYSPASKYLDIDTFSIDLTLYSRTIGV